MSRTSVFAKLASLLNASGQLLSGGVADGAVTYAKLSSDVQGDMNMFKNRIINGSMVFDQRNSGAVVANLNGRSSEYFLDRWQLYCSNNSTGNASVQQSTAAPAGFRNSLLVTVTAAQASLGANFYSMAWQKIEGFNVADLGWGAAGAQTVTLSFQVRSSVAGTFGGSILNQIQDRCFPFSYTINAANTWETKTITIPGDTSGTWYTNNQTGLIVNFGLAVGSTFGSGTAGAWSGSASYTASGATNLYATLGNTWQITGVQLEKGSTATAFDYRPYGTELALCQRYFELIYSDAAGEAIFSAPWQSSYRWVWQMKVQKRTNCAFGLLGSGNWQVATPNINGGTTNVGAYHSSSTYYLQGTPNTAVGYATAEL